MKKTLWMMTVLVMILTISSPLRAEVTTGSTAPDFTLMDTQGSAHSLSDSKGKFVLLEWTNYECPFVRKHYDSQNMQRLQETYMGKGVIWLTINSSAPGKQGNFTSEEWNRKIEEKGSKSAAVLLDTDGTIGKSYGAKTTPHIFIVNPEGKLIYRGAIDDHPSTDPDDIANSKNYVQAALDEAMAGKEVSTPETPSYGCSVKY